ncbi:membrane protein insertion efficiency factor YidD [Pantanalinema rosaneae CENA516]|uniref:membrane protein insertion efficiency factor YidD n=1 Tax=Pantanalinema rosaneae TaxID=1620701 RepID=UPI003D6F20AC
MSISPADSLTRQTASTLISFYQRQISPHKGFACAYRVLHGNESCSQYIKRTIQIHGLWQSLPLIRERFQACKAANQQLQQRSQFRRQPNLAAIEPGQATPDYPIADPNDPEQLEPNSTSTKTNSVAQPAVANSSGSTACSGCEVLECADCSGLDCGLLGDSHPCTALECDGLDCTVLDCGALDCGSCSW